MDAILAASPPIFGFGVDRDAAAAKLYVQARAGAPLPPLPATQAMPPVVAQGSRTLALEWRVGSDATALRQYAVQAGAAGAPRPDRDRLRAVRTHDGDGGKVPGNARRPEKEETPRK